MEREILELYFKISDNPLYQRHLCAINSPRRIVMYLALFYKQHFSGLSEIVRSKLIKVNTT